ncbi:MAG: DUF6159 family protein, partial [Planctomycetota bacterium]|jgi:hypothetical protein
MFATIGRSWQFAKISYGIVWDFKKLIVFPLLSTLAAILVIASFAAPLWATGTIQGWVEAADPEAGVTVTTADQVAMYATLFLFYFCNYFVIVFFNSALTACALKVVNGEAPTIGYGFSMAGKRLPQIAAWAFVSAVIGVLLRMVENAHEKAGAIVAAILGTAWTVLTYFTVPVLVMEGVGPITAIKRSVSTIKSTWGEALVGNFSMGFLAFLVLLPVILVLGVLVAAAVASGNTPAIVLAGAVGALVIVIAAAATSTADVVFKALLYNHATGRSVPEGIDQSLFQEAFRPKG